MHEMHEGIRGARWLQGGASALCRGGRRSSEGAYVVNIFNDWDANSDTFKNISAKSFLQQNGYNNPFTLPKNV